MPKHLNSVNITLSAAGTTSLPVQSSVELYRFITSGSLSITAGQTISIQPSGTTIPGLVYKIKWDATVSLANSATAIVTFFDGALVIKGDDSGTVPAVFSLNPFTVEFYYDGSAWQMQGMYSFESEGVITNTNIASAANIAVSKIALTEGSIIIGNSSDVGVALSGLTSGQILVGNGTTMTSVAVSGDITLSSAGVVAIAAGVIVNADVNASAAIAVTKLAAGSTTQVLMNNTGTNTWTTISGDVTVDATGVTAIGASKVTNTMMADNSVSLTNLDSTGQIDSFTTTTGTGANTTETTLASHAIGTAQMDADGETVDIFAYGSFANTATVKTVRLRMGATLATSTLLAANTTTGSPQNINWCIRAKIFRTGAASQKGNAEIIFSGIATELDNFTATETWSTSTLYLAGLNGTANANDIVLEGWEVVTNKENNA